MNQKENKNVIDYLYKTLREEINIDSLSNLSSG